MYCLGASDVMLSGIGSGVSCAEVSRLRLLADGDRRKCSLYWLYPGELSFRRTVKEIRFGRKWS